MTKRFKIEPDLTCPELAWYKLPEVERTPRTPIAIEVEMEREWIVPFGFIDSDGCYFDVPATNPDGTVKGRYIYE